MRHEKSRRFKARIRKTDRVLRMLREAFADVPCPCDDCDQEYHECFPDMKEHLWNIGGEEMPWELPRILAYLITSDDEDLIDYMIEHLDVDREGDYGDGRLESIAWEDSKTQEYYRESGSYLGSVLRRKYDGITPKQAAAVVEWLRYARGILPKYCWDTDFVGKPIRYWRKRALNRKRR